VLIKVTFEEIVDRDCWDEFCVLKGLDPRLAKNHSLHSTVELTLEEFRNIGMSIPGYVREEEN
jgi:hypothetical protein